MALYVPQLTFNKFRKGEVVEIDESEWTKVIERGWLKPFVEGEVMAGGTPSVDVGGGLEIVAYGAPAGSTIEVRDATRPESDQ